MAPKAPFALAERAGPTVGAETPRAPPGRGSVALEISSPYASRCEKIAGVEEETFEAVMRLRDGAYLWRVTNGKAEKVFVELVRRDQGHVLVDGPLREGDKIVVEGVQGLRAGRKLRVRPEAAPGPPATRETKS